MSKKLLMNVAGITIGTLLCASIFGEPRTAHATVPSGCVAPADAGVAHLVGWVDVGTLLGTGDPEPPALVTVIAPDGAVTDYRDGLGLIAPTDVLPIWFAPAETNGTYELVINGEERCTIVVNDGSDALTPIAAEINLDWTPQSAPVSGL